MTPEQCRAARGWLGWTQNELAGAAHVSHSTVKDFEAGKRVPIANNLAAIRAALETQGIGFVDSGGTYGITYAKPEKGEAH
jgi:transcriptional regulator with XRE-family HTH domain